MSKFEKMMRNLMKQRCEACHGSGKVDDAEPGDIYYHTFECKECGGSGIRKVKKDAQK